MPNLTADAPIALNAAVDTEDAPGLARRVRECTAVAHSSAEARPFIAQLMAGELDLPSYVRYLAQFARVYEALEARPAQPSDPAIIDPALARFGAIEADLRALGAADWRVRYPELSATAAYCDHLRGLAPDDLPRYVAHHYTRYLGDLSGGQIIGRMVERHYGATPDQLSYFRFEHIHAVVPYKRAYRDGLDALDFTEAQAELFLAEAKDAFRFNSDLFDELER